VAPTLKVSRDAEIRLRAIIAHHFRLMAAKYKSEQKAAEALGISRQRFRKYLERKMTPKADVLLVAMANWDLKIIYEGVRFSPAKRATKSKAISPEQLTLNYFDEPQILREGNIEVRVSRKQNATLKLALEVRLAG